MKKIVVAFLILTICFVSVYATPKNQTYNSPSAVGFGFYFWPDAIVGGLQYQHWFGKFGLETTLGGWISNVYYSNDAKVELAKEIKVNASICPQFSLYRHSSDKKRISTDLYVWLLAGYHGFTTNYAVGSSTDSKNFKFISNAIAGMGLGIELVFVEHLSIPIIFGFCGEFPNDPSMGMSFGTSIKYRF